MGVQGMPAPVKLKGLEGTNYMTGGSRKGRTLKSAPILGPVSSADDLGQSLILTYPLSARLSLHANGREVTYTKRLAWAWRRGAPVALGERIDRAWSV